MTTSTPKRSWTPATPTTDRSEASDIIGAGLSPFSPAQADLEAQEDARVKRRRLLRQSSSEAEWLAMLKQSESEKKKAQQTDTTDVALASLLDACCFVIPWQEASASARTTLASTSASPSSQAKADSTK